jgi:nucleotide-binding universal stress UspA family protein
MRITRVLCPVDFSDPSLRALHHAAAVAAWYHAPLDVLHVVPEPMPAALPLMMVGLRPAAEDVKAVAARALGDFIVRARLAAPRRAEVRDGPAVETIVGYAAEIGADLLVMGSHGREGLGHLLFGSTAERVLHKAPCPVLVVPLHAAEPSSADRVRFSRILCAVDFSPPSARGLELALSLAREAGGSLTVLHVVEALTEPELEALPPTGVRLHVDALTSQARERLHASVPREAHAWADVVETVRYGRAALAILREAEERGADLIVLGAEGHRGLGRMMLGSATHTVVRRAACPVLTVRAVDAA